MTTPKLFGVIATFPMRIACHVRASSEEEAIQKAREVFAQPYRECDGDGDRDPEDGDWWTVWDQRRAERELTEITVEQPEDEQ
jgi:hypothetical protein